MLHSRKKRNELKFAETCMHLEIVVQYEISQKEKKMYKITYIWNLEKLYR